jgi:hypothetical protein
MLENVLLSSDPVGIVSLIMVSQRPVDVVLLNTLELVQTLLNTGERHI